MRALIIARIVKGGFSPQRAAELYDENYEYVVRVYGDEVKTVTQIAKMIVAAS